MVVVLATAFFPFFTLAYTDPAEPAITVTSPSGGETLLRGQIYNITWESTGFGANDTVSVIIFSEENTYKIVSSTLASNGSKSWTVATTIVPGDKYKISVYSDTHSEVYGVNDDYIKIVAPIVSLCPATSINGYSIPVTKNGSSIKVSQKTTVLNGIRRASTTFTCEGETFVAGPETANITCNVGYFSVGVSCVTKALSLTITDNKKTYSAGQVMSFNVKGIASDRSVATPDKGFNVQYWNRQKGDTNTYSVNNAIFNPKTGYWSVTATAPTNTYQIYEQGIALYCSQPNLGCSVGQITKSFIFNVIPSITITSLNGGETITQGQKHDITWESVGFGVNDRVSIKIFSPKRTYKIISSVSALSGSYSWSVPSNIVSGQQYKIGVYFDKNNKVYDVSDNYIIITAPVVAGSLNISKDSSSPISNIALGGELANLAVFRLSASSAEALDINKIKVTVDGQSSLISSVSIYSGTVLLATGMIDQNNVATFILPAGKLIVSANSNIGLTVKAIISEISDASQNDSTITAKLNGNDAIAATGVTSSAIISSGSQSAIGSPMNVFKARPYFSINPNSPSGSLILSSSTLLGIINVNSSAKGDITFSNANGNYIKAKIAVSVTDGDGDLEQLVLKDGMGQTLDIVNQNLGIDGVAIPITFDFSNNSLVVAGGQTKQLYIYGDTMEFDDAGDTIQVLLEDYSPSNISWGIDGQGAYNNADIIFRGGINTNAIYRGGVGLNLQQNSSASVLGAIINLVQAIFNK